MGPTTQSERNRSNNQSWEENSDPRTTIQTRLINIRRFHEHPAKTCLIALPSTSAMSKDAPADTALDVGLDIHGLDHHLAGEDCEKLNVEGWQRPNIVIGKESVTGIVY